MSEKKGKKRPKSYYIKCANGGKKPKHANDLDVGMRGFLVTCNKFERETVREMYNILNEYGDKIYGPEKQVNKEESDNDSEEEDMEKAMLKEAAEIKEASNNVRRFQNTDTKTKNLIFIRTTLEDPCELAHAIFTDVHDKQVQKARYALRVLPVAVTCKANVSQISEKAKELFKKDFETSFGVGLKFTSICKIRNNNSVSRTAILPSLSRIVQEMNPLHSLCHDEPDLVIMVEVIRNICCLSVIKDYFKFKKYNLHEIVTRESNTSEQKTQHSKESSHCMDRIKEENQVKELEAKTLNDSETNVSDNHGGANATDNYNQVHGENYANESSLGSIEIMNDKVGEDIVKVEGIKVEGTGIDNKDIDEINGTKNDWNINNDCKDIAMLKTIENQTGEANEPNNG